MCVDNTVMVVNKAKKMLLLLKTLIRNQRVLKRTFCSWGHITNLGPPILLNQKALEWNNKVTHCCLYKKKCLKILIIVMWKMYKVTPKKPGLVLRTQTISDDYIGNPIGMRAKNPNVFSPQFKYVVLWG